MRNITTDVAILIDAMTTTMWIEGMMRRVVAVGTNPTITTLHRAPLREEVEMVADMGGIWVVVEEITTVVVVSSITTTTSPLRREDLG